jgi:hypothetical protein
MGCFTWVDYGRFYLLIYLCGGADVLLLLVKTGNVFLNDEFDLYLSCEDFHFGRLVMGKSISIWGQKRKIKSGHVEERINFIYIK